MVVLTQQEREKLATWCTQNADANKGIAVQMEKMPSNQALQMMLRRNRAEEASCRIVAALLRSIETETIGPEETARQGTEAHPG